MNYKKLSTQFEKISKTISETRYFAEKDSETMILISCLKAAEELISALEIEFSIRAEKPF